MSLNVVQASCLSRSLTLLLNQQAGWEPALRLVVTLSDMHPRLGIGSLDRLLTRAT
ncbi:MAG: hypothetical protein V1899_06780 [Planctomycetota bacterium]